MSEVQAEIDSNNPEVKQEIPEVDLDSIQEAFDKIIDTLVWRDDFDEKQSELDTLISKGAKLNYDYDFFRILYRDNIKAIVWVLDNTESKKELISNVLEDLEGTHHLHYFIFECVENCKHAQYYYKLIIDSDKIHASLKNTIVKLMY